MLLHRRAHHRIALACAVLLPVMAPAIGAGPAGAATSQVYAYVGFEGDGDGGITVVDITSNQTVTTIPIGHDVISVAARPDSDQIYALALTDSFTEPDNTVYVIDTATNTVTASIPVSTNANDVVINAAGTVAYVDNGFDGTVSAIDTTTQKIIRTFTPTDTPSAYDTGGISLSSNGKMLYAGFVGSTANYIVEFNTTTGAQTKVITVGTQFNGATPGPNGKRLYLTGSAEVSPGERVGTFAVLNASTGKQLASTVIGPSPTGLALSPDGKTAWVADSQINAVFTIDTATATVQAITPTAGGAISEAYYDGTLYLPIAEANLLYLVSTTSTIPVNSEFPVGDIPYTVAVIAHS